MERLRAQRLGLIVGAVVVCVATLGVIGVLLLIGAGTDEHRHIPARSASRGRLIYTLRRGDVVRVPTAATRCEASAESGIANL